MTCVFFELEGNTADHVNYSCTAKTAQLAAQFRKKAQLLQEVKADVDEIEAGGINAGKLHLPSMTKAGHPVEIRKYRL